MLKNQVLKAEQKPFDRISIMSIADYYSVLENKLPGDEISVTVHRDKKDLKFTVVLAE